MRFLILLSVLLSFPAFAGADESECDRYTKLFFQGEDDYIVPLVCNKRFKKYAVLERVFNKMISDGEIKGYNELYHYKVTKAYKFYRMNKDTYTMKESAEIIDLAKIIIDDVILTKRNYYNENHYDYEKFHMFFYKHFHDTIFQFNNRYYKVLGNHEGSILSNEGISTIKDAIYYSKACWDYQKLDAWTYDEYDTLQNYCSDMLDFYERFLPLEEARVKFGRACDTKHDEDRKKCIKTYFEKYVKPIRHLLSTYIENDEYIELIRYINNR